MEPHKFLGNNFNELSKAERIKLLNANADEILADQKIVRPISTDEKEASKEEYVQASIELASEESIYSEVKKEWKEKLDPIKKRKKENLVRVATGYEEITAAKYLIRDHEAGRVYTFIDTGQLIDDRRMMEHERQSTINNVRSING